MVRVHCFHKLGHQKRGLWKPPSPSELLRVPPGVFREKTTHRGGQVWVILRLLHRWAQRQGWPHGLPSLPEECSGELRISGWTLHSRNPLLETKQASSTDTLKTKFPAPYLGEQAPRMPAFKEHGHTLSKQSTGDVTYPSIHKKSEFQDKRKKTLAVPFFPGPEEQRLTHHTQKRKVAQADSIR